MVPTIIVSPDGKAFNCVTNQSTKLSKLRILPTGKTMSSFRIMVWSMSQGKAIRLAMKLSPDGKDREMPARVQKPATSLLIVMVKFIYDADMSGYWCTMVPSHTINHGIGGERLEVTSKKWENISRYSWLNWIWTGCSTGVIVGTDAKFPTHYRDDLHLDWTFATMYSIHLNPWFLIYYEKRISSNSDGSLALTDVDNGPAAYFLRVVSSPTYRVSYKGTESTALSKLDTTSKHNARSTRRMLENFHMHPTPKQ